MLGFKLFANIYLFGWLAKLLRDELALPCCSDWAPLPVRMVRCCVGTDGKIRLLKLCKLSARTIRAIADATFTPPTTTVALDDELILELEPGRCCSSFLATAAETDEPALWPIVLLSNVWICLRISAPLAAPNVAENLGRVGAMGFVRELMNIFVAVLPVAVNELDSLFVDEDVSLRLVGLAGEDRTSSLLLPVSEGERSAVLLDLTMFESDSCGRSLVLIK
jgi:hypothetical protein